MYKLFVLTACGRWTALAPRATLESARFRAAFVRRVIGRAVRIDYPQEVV